MLGAGWTGPGWDPVELDIVVCILQAFKKFTRLNLGTLFLHLEPLQNSEDSLRLFHLE